MCNILLIEDDLIDQMAFTRMLEKQKFAYKYQSVMSIQEAKELLKKQSFNIVISDYNLADGTMFDLIDDLKGIPFIVITGNEDDATKAAVLQNGAIACLTKDLNLKYLEEIPDIINGIINKKPNYTSPPVKNYKTNPLLIEGNVSINISNLFKIFGNDRNLVKECIEIFLTHKPRELENLHKAIFLDKDCSSAARITHRMRSGFRVLGMKHQEKIANTIESAAVYTNCNCDSLTDSFNNLSIETKIAIKLLEKELPLL